MSVPFIVGTELKCEINKFVLKTETFNRLFV